MCRKSFVYDADVSYLACEGQSKAEVLVLEFLCLKDFATIHTSSRLPGQITSLNHPLSWICSANVFSESKLQISEVQQLFTKFDTSSTDFTSRLI